MNRGPGDIGSNCTPTSHLGSPVKSRNGSASLIATPIPIRVRRPLLRFPPNITGPLVVATENSDSARAALTSLLQLRATREHGAGPICLKPHNYKPTNPRLSG